MCHITYLNPLKMHPEAITKADRRMVNNLDHVDIKFPISKDYSRIKKKKVFPLMYIVMKMIWFVLFIYQMKNSKILWIYCRQQMKISRIMSISKI